ncbi:MAG: hypothetical protein ACHQNT_08990 [Bacteroidia bacterium]
MNLFYYPTLSDLNSLFSKCDHNINYYDIKVDHDGEVLIEPGSPKNKSMLDRYKFYFRRAFKGNDFLNGHLAENKRRMNQILNDLIFCWDNNLRGSVEHDKLMRIESNSRWKHQIAEVKKAAREKINTAVTTAFGKYNLYTPATFK